MELETPETLIKLLIEAGIASDDTVFGCTDSQIANIESTFKIKLPESYKAFLKVMGVEAGDFFDEYGLFNIPSIEAIEETRKDARSFVLEYANRDLKDSDFVFAESGRVTYLWFDTTAGPEPPIQMLDDGDAEVKTPFQSFLEFLNIVAAEQLESTAILKADLD
ncbi:MAG: SMI1/KNR4 family protein [Cyanobacteria bacterium SZAS-4]|nr:SMI1/KNR4 family protein [Cyanobacteria bacterium SZAS-4]